MNYRRNIKADVEKMDRPPKPGGNIFPGVGNGNQNNHQIQANCPERDKQRFIIGMKRNENIRKAKRDEFVEKKGDSVDQGEN